MGKCKLEKAYEELKIEEYLRVVGDTLIPLFDDYDMSYNAVITKDTKFEISKHYYEGQFMGWNIYASNGGKGELIETKNSYYKALKYLKKLLDKINIKR